MIRRPALSNGFERYISEIKLKKAKINPENEITFKNMANKCHLLLVPLSNLSGNVFTMMARFMNAWEAIKKKARLNNDVTSKYRLSEVLTIISRIKDREIIAPLNKSK